MKGRGCGLALHVVLKGGFALAAKDHRFDPIKRWKLFRELISRLTTYHELSGAGVFTGRFLTSAENAMDSDHPRGISTPSFRTAPLWVMAGEEFEQPLNKRDYTGYKCSHFRVLSLFHDHRS